MKKLVTSVFLIPFVLSAQTTLTTAGGGNVDYCSSHATHPGTNAFDQRGDINDSRWLADRSAMPNAYVTYSFANKVVINGYAVFGLADTNYGADRSPKSWSLEGSSNMRDWVYVDSRTNQTEWTSLQVRRFETAVTNSFRHWRFTMHEHNGATDYVGIQELEYYGHPDLSPEPPVISALPYEHVDYGAVRLRATLDEGGRADAFFVWGDAPGELSNTNVVEEVFDIFSTVLSGLDDDRTYLYTIFVTNEHGRAELPAPLSFTTLPRPMSLTWSGADEADNNWHTPGNWTPAQVPRSVDPVTIGAGAPIDNPIVIDAPAVSAGVTFNTPDNYIAITADWLVNGSFYTGVGNRRTINHTSGTVTVTDKLETRSDSSAQFTYNLSGPDSMLVVSNAIQLGGYNGTRNHLTVSDSARVDTGSLALRGQNANGLTYFTLHDNASMLIRNALTFSSAYVAVISNSTLTVNGMWMLAAVGTEARVDTGATITAGSLVVGQYNNSNVTFNQYGGDITISTLAVSGYGQGGTGTGSNNRYVLHGGNLNVTGGTQAAIGSNGHAVFEQFGGRVIFNAGLNVKVPGAANLASHWSQVIFHEGAEAVVGGTAHFNKNRGELRVAGNAASNDKLSFNNITFDASSRFTPVITANGFTPVHVGNKLRVYDDFTVNPVFEDGAKHGTYTLLTYEALDTTTPEQLEAWVKLAPGAEDEVDGTLRLSINTANRCVTLRYSATGALLIIR